MSDENKNIDLSFATFDELVKEIIIRSRAAVIIASLKAETSYPVKVRQFGDRHLRRGLIEDVIVLQASEAYLELDLGKQKE